MRALQAWLEHVEDGPLFRSINRHGHLKGRLGSKGVSIAVKRSAERVGLDPEKYGAHSLRAGFATQAANAGVSERSIMRQTGHASLKVLRGYIRNGNLFRENASTMLGL